MNASILPGTLCRCEGLHVRAARRIDSARSYLNSIYENTKLAESFFPHRLDGTSSVIMFHALPESHVCVPNAPRQLALHNGVALDRGKVGAAAVRRARRRVEEAPVGRGNR